MEKRAPEGPGIFSRESKSFEGQAHLPPTEEPAQPQSLPELLPLITKEGFSRIQFQRGCKFACTFCSFPFKDRAFRRLELGTLRSDLANLCGAGVTTLAVLDPIFFEDKARALVILDALHEELPQTRLEIQSRLEQMDTRIIERLSTMNVLLECGVQTMDPLIQREIKRGGSSVLARENLVLMQKRGVCFETHLIFGLPHQSLESFLSDLDFLMEFDPERIRAYPLLGLKGTLLSGETRTKYLGQMTFSEDFPRQVLSTAWMSPEEVATLKRLHAFLEETPRPASLGLSARDLFAKFRNSME